MKMNGFASVESLEEMIKRLKILLAYTEGRDTKPPKNKKRKGGKVSRRGGGKIMQGYKAGGKV